MVVSTSKVVNMAKLIPGRFVHMVLYEVKFSRSKRKICIFGWKKKYGTMDDDVVFSCASFLKENLHLSSSQKLLKNDDSGKGSGL